MEDCLKLTPLAPPPYKIKAVEPIYCPSREERLRSIAAAGYNTFLLPSNEVYLDLLTDSGTGAMSDYQWAGLMEGDEAYAGSVNFAHLEEAVHDIMGYRCVVPTHQGRGAEHILSKLLIKPGHYIPGNMYFTTTRLHQELAGGMFVDVIIDEAYQAQNEHPFKGNVDLEKLAYLVQSVGKEKIPYVNLQACVNMAGGQPFSMENLCTLREFCSRHEIKIILDATRVVENAHFIKTREKGYQNRSILSLMREICSLTDGCTMSAKKDALVNIGGFLALRDAELYEEAKALVVIYEGLHTYGGLAGRDLEAMARGLYEATTDDAIVAHRVQQVHYLGERLSQFDVPLVRPFGGHAIFIDAKRFLAHLAQDQFPAEALAAEIYTESGVRTMERGIVSAGRDPKTGDHYYPALELVRLTLPRRVYTQEHLDYTAEHIEHLFKRRDLIKGLRMIYEPKYLRFFQARFEPLT
ncbi:MAG: tyrosine phenol-lyase [Deltaproteobacteria bacterium]|nr:tyrosine phenol-lyase [Deltaproteobacteria bacterium]